MVGDVCYVGWPYLVEAKVYALSDGKTKYYQDSGCRSKVKIVECVLKEAEIKSWREEKNIASRE